MSMLITHLFTCFMVKMKQLQVESTKKKQSKLYIFEQTFELSSSPHFFVPKNNPFSSSSAALPKTHHSEKSVPRWAALQLKKWLENHLFCLNTNFGFSFDKITTRSFLTLFRTFPAATISLKKTFFSFHPSKSVSELPLPPHPLFCTS